MNRFFSFLTWGLFVSSWFSPETLVAQETVYERDVRPILKAACFHCHGEGEKVSGGLDVRLVRLMTAGGDSGPVIVPGKSADSLLFQRVRDGEMPPDPTHRLTEQQVLQIQRWIDAGARTSRQEPESPDEFFITDEERSHWSFQPLKRPAVPTVQHQDLVRNPIDAFLLKRLEDSGFSYSPEAPPATLLRRTKLDLLGLPPSPDELAEFQTSLEASPDSAYEQIIELFLASPQYGERWGRHWLDTAGYADSEGYSIEDHPRPHAWRYRDYVIKSFNEDKPFDRFIIEQLAGDELITSPRDNLTPEDAELLVATGFLRMAPDGTAGTVDDQNIARNDVVAETIKIVTSSLMGMTVGCAQCHDHRYDPIPQTDYYRMRAVFEPALNWKSWKNPRQRLVSLYTDADRAKAAEIELQAKQVEEVRTAKQTEFINATFEKELAKLPEEIRDDARKARETADKDRTPEQASLLKKYPSLNVSAGSLYLYDSKAAAELKKLADEAASIRSTKPVEEFVHCLSEPEGQPPETFLFSRGDHDQPKQLVTPGELSVVSLNCELPEIAVDDPDRPTTGRRLALARRLTDPRHPLTARVLVNRIWLHHFGRGLVATPADFGKLGALPTHPDLLDWLAAEFIDSGWSMKHMHRLIMQSTAYRQAGRSNSELEAADPDNLLYGGSRLRRLEAEVIRDSLLFVAGKLEDRLAGKPVPIMADNAGRWVLGIENLDAGRPGKVIPMGADEFRRSVYVEVRRSRPLAVLDAFDWPRMSPNCDQRRTSTVAPQSLMLMNSDFSLQVAESFSQRVRQQAETAEQRVDLAWTLALGRTPDSSEKASALEFLRAQAETFQGEAASSTSRDKGPSESSVPEQRALDTLCQMLLSCNEFLYVD